MISPQALFEVEYISYPPRRYSRLNVRYARLRQTPVRFTFTQGGEMVEEEDYEGPDSPDEEEEEGHTNNSDVKMKIVQ